MISLQLIPTQEHEFYHINSELNSFNAKVMEVFGQDALSLTSSYHYAYSYLFKTIALIYGTTIDAANEPPLFRYRKDSSYNFREAAMGASFIPDTRGIFINEEASTHYSAEGFNNPLFMPAVEEHLKQTPNHFLKIFTTDSSNIVFVYTNKTLEPETVYHLIALEAKLHNASNQTLQDLMNAFIDKDKDTASKVLNLFLDSDTIKDFRYKRFIKVLTGNTDHKIQKLKNNINSKRDSIAEYERYISMAAAEIRDLTEQMHFLKATANQEEDNKTLYKYLMKHPYIKEFTPSGRNTLVLYIESPIVYYSSTPIEKYLEQNWRDEADKDIFRLFLSDEYEYWTRTKMSFDTINFATQAMTLDRSDTLMPQPHIAEFGCFGNHRNAIAESAEQHDYIGALEQICQATMNLNFYDACVVDNLLEKLQKDSTKITWKKKSTGEMLSTEQAIDDYERSIKNEEA